MKSLAALLLLAMLVSCASPTPEPTDQIAVVEPGVVCRVSHSGGPVMTDRGIGGTGMRVVERGIGGTGIIGVVTGFASICVDGLEVRFDKTVPVVIDGVAATTGQLRAGQLVVIQATGPTKGADSPAQAKTISVRHEVSGPVEAIDVHSGTIVVAGQRVKVLPSTWVAGRFVVSTWTAVSGLRQADGTIVASRLDPVGTAALAVRGQVTRQGDTTRIGGLVLHGSVAGIVRVGAFVSVVGKYRDGAAEVTSIDEDLLPENPAGYFGASTRLVVMQAFVRVEHGTVTLNNGQTFQAGPNVQGIGSLPRNAIVRLERGADGGFTATDLRYTSYRAQAPNLPSKAGNRGGNDGISPPPLPPWMPSSVPMGSINNDGGAIGSTDLAPDGDTLGAGSSGLVPALTPNDTPVSSAVPNPVSFGPGLALAPGAERHPVFLAAR